MPSTKTKATAPPAESEDRAKTAGDDKVSIPAAGNNAKKQMLSMFNRPAPPPVRHVRHSTGGSGDSTSLCRIQGVCVRTKDEEVTGPGGKIPKRRIDVIVTSIISNGAQDLVKTGVEGQTFLFPSRVVDTPDATASADGGAFKAKPRELCVSPLQTVRQLSVVSASFYRESKDGAANGVNAVEIGSTVEISGLCVNTSTRGGTTNYYLNASKVTLLASDDKVNISSVSRKMIDLASGEKMQELSAFGCSSGMHGWFGAQDLAGLNTAQHAQAKQCQAMWARLVKGAADRLESMAGGKDESLAGEITGHEQRVRATDPARLAAGDVSLFLTDKYDVNIAPLVQKGLTPADKTPDVIHQLQGSVKEQLELPDIFTAPFIVKQEIKGKALLLDFQVAMVFNKGMAVEASDKGDDNPLLISTGAVISTTLSMREMAHKFCSLHESKVKTAVTELLPSATFAVFPVVNPVVQDGEVREIKSDFPLGGTLFFDMAATLGVCSAKVSEDFIKQVLCGGGNVRVAPPTAKDVVKLDLPDKVTDMPSLANDGYEELTGSSFDITNWADLEGSIEYRVVFQDVAEAVVGDKGITTDTKAGEAYVTDLAPGGVAKLKAWLTNEALVYAVLVK